METHVAHSSCGREQPLLNPFEAEVALKATPWRKQYPMDFYSADSGPWTNYHQTEEEKALAAKAKAARRAARARRRKDIAARKAARKKGAGDSGAAKRIELAYET